MKCGSCGFLNHDSVRACNSCGRALPHKGVGGWLLLFCVGLTALGPLLTLANISNGITEASKYSDRFPSVMAVTIVDSVLSVFLMAFSIYAGVCLWRVKPNAIKTAKTYLLVLLGYSILEIPLPFAAGLPSQTNDAIMVQGITRAARILVYVLVWTAYLNRSKRVEATYGEPTPAEYIGLGLGASNQSQAGNPSIDSMKKASGVYICHGDDSERIELNLDGAFRLQKGHVDLAGSFEASDNILTFILPSGQTTHAKLSDDKFTDEDGKTWLRMHQESEVGHLARDFGSQANQPEETVSHMSRSEETIPTGPKYRVISVDGIEYESVGPEILRQLFLHGQVNKDSLMNDASGGQWRRVGDRFNVTEWEKGKGE